VKDISIVSNVSIEGNVSIVRSVSTVNDVSKNKNSSFAVDCTNLDIASALACLGLPVQEDLSWVLIW